MQQAAHLSYQQSLGAIGRYLDQHGYDSLVLCELADGFVARASRGDQLPQVIPFPLSDLHTLVRTTTEELGRARPEPPPTTAAERSFIQRSAGNYRDFLAAFGRQCDQVGAGTILVMELGDAVLVSYQKAGSGYESWDACAHEYLYNEQGVRKLLLGSAFALKR
jgi:hypothetical protein